MDVLSVIASVVGILDATAKLIGFVKDVRAAKKELWGFHVEMEIVLHVLRALNTSVVENPETFRATSKALRDEQRILAEFNSFLVSLKEKLVAKPGRRLLWPLDKSDIKQDVERIQRYKAILICALQNDSMFVCRFFFSGLPVLQSLDLCCSFPVAETIR